MEITVDVVVDAPMERVWNAWISPEAIQNWNFASDTWCCPDAKIDFVVGGEFSHRMEAKDGSMGFDFGGRFVRIDEHERIEFVMGDDRKVSVIFSQTPQGVSVVETFDAENQNSAELQKQGWQSILNNFKKHVESAAEVKA